MPRARRGLLHIGIKGHVIALDRATGSEVWRTKLEGIRMKMHDFVHLHRDADGLYASYNGVVFCLDPATGAMRWRNELKGLGTGVTSLLSDAAERRDSGPVSLVEQHRRVEAARHSSAG